MPYSAVIDLLIGNIPVGSVADPSKYVQDASDEIDSAIGHIYQTPVDVTEGGPTSRPACLLLKRINNWLASGRLMMAAAAGTQRTEVHAYANKLVNDATAALEAIASGDVPLAGAVRLDESGSSGTGPLIYNEDAESNVEAFYNRIANPSYAFLPTWRPRSDGLVS